MYIDLINEKIVMVLCEFDIEKTEIELKKDFIINTLKIPKKYKECSTTTLNDIIINVKENIEYV
jgi:hypothetical protein